MPLGCCSRSSEAIPLLGNLFHPWCVHGSTGSTGVIQDAALLYSYYTGIFSLPCSQAVAEQNRKGEVEIFAELGSGVQVNLGYSDNFVDCTRYMKYPVDYRE